LTRLHIGVERPARRLVIELELDDMKARNLKAPDGAKRKEYQGKK